MIFVEVKRKSEKLSTEQIKWGEFLVKNQILYIIYQFPRWHSAALLRSTASEFSLLLFSAIVYPLFCALSMFHVKPYHSSRTNVSRETLSFLPHKCFT